MVEWLLSNTCIAYFDVLAYTNNNHRMIRGVYYKQDQGLARCAEPKTRVFDVKKVALF